MTHRVAALLSVALLITACSGGAGTIGMPTPTPTPAPSPTATPAPGGFGTVIGRAAAAATSQPARAALQGPTLSARRPTGRPVYVPNQLLLKPLPGVSTSAASALHARFGASVLRTIDRVGLQVVRLGQGVVAAQAMAAYRTSGLFEYVEQDGYAYATATPTDPGYASQAWHYGQINLPTAWDTTTGGLVIVAVLDTGIRFDHPDLAAVTVAGFDWITDTANGDGDGPDADPTDPGCPNVNPPQLSHGTHVAGTVAARTNNAQFGAGVTWGGVAATRIMPVRVLGQVPPFASSLDCGVGTYSDIASAIVWAADHGAKVISMSFGGGPTTALDSAITYARGLGVTLVAAAGNDGCGPINYPASNSDVIAVGATANANPATRASYSSCGSQLDVMAPGGDGSFFIWSTSWASSVGSVFAGFQGTSMATPHVSAVIALMISRGITGPASIQNVLQSTATDLGTAGFDTETGWGLINAAAAIGAGAGPTRQCAFTGVVNGTTISRESALVAVQSSGDFTITGAPSGFKSVFVWQDIDGNGSVSTGDLYGRVDGVTIFPGGTTSLVTVSVQTYGTGSLTGAPTLTVTPGGASTCP